MATSDLLEWKRFMNTLTKKEREVIKASIETLRTQAASDPLKHSVVVIERHGRKFQVYETTPRLFLDLY